MSGKAMFPIRKGDTVEVRHDLNLWGFGYVDTKKGEVLMLDSNPADGSLHQQWAMGDIDGDGKIDFALINHDQYEKHVDKPRNVSLYISDEFYKKDDYRYQDVIGEMQTISGCTIGCKVSTSVVVRKESEIFGEAQKVYGQIKGVQKGMKKRFVESESFGSFDGQVEWIAPDGESKDLHLEVDNYQYGAEVCFMGKSDSWTPNMSGMHDGVRYSFAKTQFSDAEVKSVCSRIEGHKSYN
ncbi:MAG: hypothetical protein HN337_02525 [Deltaproteobacteria bacterium]|jgi:hypothetical protein|nr:hypothetical protein [Deltaproteobacteria bacterium]